VGSQRGKGTNYVPNPPPITRSIYFLKRDEKPKRETWKSTKLGRAITCNYDMLQNRGDLNSM